MQLRQGNLSNVKLFGANYNRKFDGNGKFERSDKFTMKIEAEVIDVKPNGVLVLEARKMLDKNGETQSVVLSGSCRGEDVTQNNTVFSSQLANLTVISKNTGQVNEAGKKGILSQVIDTIFAF
jgi:flagellar L-ring protein FlgH